MDPPMIGAFNKKDWVDFGFGQYLLNKLGYRLTAYHSEDMGIYSESLLRGGFVGFMPYYIGLVFGMAVIFLLVNVLPGQSRYYFMPLLFMIILQLQIYSSGYLLRWFLFGLIVHSLIF